MQLSRPDAFRSESLVRAVLVGLLCTIPAIVCLRTAGVTVADPDVGWHLQTAEWILQHHAVPHTDPFSRVTGGTAWQAYSWLFDLVLLKLYHSLRLEGLVVFSAAMMTLIAGATYHMLSRLQADFTLRILLAAGAMICVACVGTPRPWLFTLLFFVLEMDILMHARRTGSSRELLWLPLLFALWANLHIQFVDGLLVLGVAACEPLLERWWKSGTPSGRARPLWIALAASAAAACLNPYGPGIYRIAWQMGSQSGVLDVVTEMRSLPFRTFGDFLLLFLALAAAGVLFRYRRFAPFETIMLAMAAVLSFRSRRDLWVMAFTAVAILAAGIPVRSGREDRSPVPAWTPIVSALTIVAAFLGSATLLHVNNPRLEKLLAEKMPAQAVEVVRAHHYTGALFNTYDWGGFLIWKLREPVSIDGRAGLYGDARIDRSLKTWGGGPDWAEDPDLRSAGVVIAPRSAALTQILRLDPHYSVAYEDKVATVFVARRDQVDSAAGQTHKAGPDHPSMTPVTILTQRAAR